MACRLVDLTAAGNCRDIDGGIAVSYIAELADVTDVTIDGSGVVTNFVMGTVGKWVKYQFDTDDDTASYNQPGSRTGNKHTTEQTATFKFGGVNATSVDFANGIVQCCELIAVHFFNNGVALVQGIQYDEDTTSWKVSKKALKATISVLSDTGDNEDRTEVQLISTSKTFSQTTTLTAAALEAL